MDTAAATTAVAAGAGFFGKVPARGDFVGAGLPASFTAPWDAWLRAALANARARVGDAAGASWHQAFLVSPVWRFLLAPGACGPDGWIGIVASSADGVGRLYPLTLALPVPDADPALIDGWDAGYERLIDLGLLTIGGGIDLDAVPAALASLVAELPAPPAQPPATWEQVLRPGDCVRIAPLPPGRTAASACLPVIAHAGEHWTAMWRIGWGLPPAALVGCGLPDTQRHPTLWEDAAPG